MVTTIDAPHRTRRSAVGTAGRETVGGSRWWSGENLPVMVKIFVVALVTALAAGTAAVVAVARLGTVAAETQDVYDNDLIPTTYLDKLRTDVISVRMNLLLIIASTTEKQKATATQAMAADDKEITDLVSKYRPMTKRPDALDAFVTHWADYVQFRDSTLVPLAVKGDMFNFVTQRASGANPRIAKVMADLDTLTTAEKADATADVQDARHSYTDSRILVILLLVGGLAIASVIAVVLATAVRRALRRATAVGVALAQGDFTVRSGVVSRDEIGVMARHLDNAADSLATTLSEMTRTADTVAAASGQLAGTIGQITAAADTSALKADLVANGAEEVTASMSNVAGAVEEMSASIREIAVTAGQAAATAGSAASEAEAIQDTVAKLGESSQQIGNVITLINAIAEQTNLLALNATIEAARAGEAGKGFAVVATEVKDLAHETAKATHEIAERIEAIQSDAESAVAAIDKITSTVASISTLQTTIAGAVEEQTATTTDISGSIQSAAGGSSQITASIGDVASAATVTRTGIDQAQQATTDLARTAEELRTLTGRFKIPAHA
ncbi:MAG TPA: methyl-accepting chemotaxis protein [Kineosporiaceae bacterium]|nr:methyl-accepting chemotaxis protein [Kineosporiaceae bacterium]